MRQNGSVPTNKRNGLAISRIDEEYCFIRADKTESACEMGGEKQEEWGEKRARKRKRKREEGRKQAV